MSSTLFGPKASLGKMPAALRRIDWQAALFAPGPRRMALQGLAASWPLRGIVVAVHRNAPFEYVAQAMPPFLAYAGLAAEFRFGDYDDSLAFSDGGAADVHLVWLDYERYRDRLAPEALAAWLADRLGQLRSRSLAPILVANWGAADAAAMAFDAALERHCEILAGLRICDRRPLIEAMGESYWDSRLAAVGATNLSGPATLAVARDLGLRWLPAALRPRLKCIAVDFDNMLYAGVLGEDGVAGVRLTDAHRALQERLVALHGEGLFLAGLSKNEARDVERLLGERKDFPLRREHFSAMAISWSSKAAGLAEVADALNIGADSILFVDDNLGEIAEVAAAFPETPCVYGADPTLALAELSLGPDLLAWGPSGSDRLRATDLAANAARAQMARTADPLAYLGALETRLDFALDPADQIGRIAELSGKTNQFNLAMGRHSEAEVARWLGRDDARAVTVALSDRLSDSGIVAILLMRVEGPALLVEEICISCRALGRKLETLMIATAAGAVADREGCREIRFAHATGPRNAPARTWLADFISGDIGEEQGYCGVDYPWPDLAASLQAMPVILGWR
jgi:FkbH-like protein